MSTRSARFPSRLSLAACIASVFSLASPAIMAGTATWTVTDCSNDASASIGNTNNRTGSLRFAVANAASGDKIDISQLTCSVITLSTGAITVAQTDLTLKGLGANKPLIIGKYGTHRFPDRIFNHQGSGTLRLESLSVEEGYMHPMVGDAKGGCIYSKGNVFLDHAEVSYCEAKSSAGKAFGGGVYTKGSLTANYSSLSNDVAFADSGNYIAGGGAYVHGALTLQSSTVSHNTAFRPDGGSTGRGLGGGLFLAGNASTIGSTISDNTAYSWGGIAAHPDPSAAATTTVSITNSTISGNHANLIVGGIYSSAGTLTLQNSTITFNTEAVGQRGSNPPSFFSAGLAISAFTDVTANLQSTLIANNTYGASGTLESDLSVVHSAFNTATFSGAKNLIRVPAPTTVGLPSDTTIAACPLMGPLRDNGGPTYTHALLSHSPGIDAQNNISGLSFDQRGSPFVRVDNGTADIGAYEVQQADIVFNTSFESCP